MNKFFTILFILAFTGCSIFSQTETTIVEAKSYSCEMNHALAFGIEAESKANNEKVFIIFRAGNEEGAKTNSKRLKFVRDFFRTHNLANSDRFIFAIGEKVKGQGRVEFYLGSRLYFVALTKKGKNPCMDCC